MQFYRYHVKADPFSSYGYNGKTIYDDRRSTKTTLNQIYQLTFNGLGKVNSIREKYELIMGSPLILNRSQSKSTNYDIHPFFEYLMKKLMAYDALSLQKFTEYNPRGLNQFTKKEDNEKAGASEKIKQIVFILLKDLNARIQKLSDEQKKQRQKRLEWLQKLTKQMKEQCWTSYDRLVKSGFIQPCLKGFNFQRKQAQVMSQQQRILVKKIFQQVNALQPLRENAQLTKIRIFQKKHKNYYLTAFVKEKDEIYQSINQNKILLKKPSNSPELLHNLQEHTRLREKDQNMNAICVTIMKEVCNQLKKYMNTVSSENVKFFYQSLSPTSVLLDQLSLRPKLSFEPLLLDAIGLKKKPLSLQNSIVFFPTAQTFDYFQSLPQLEQQNKPILDDPFYGCIQMFSEQRSRLTQDQKFVIYNNERPKLQALKQKMLVWRFMLTSHYLTRGVAFGCSSSSKGNQSKQKEFKKLLKDKCQEIQKDMSKLGQFMFGQFKAKYTPQSKKFQFTFEELYNYLDLNSDRDEIIENLKFKRIKKYHNLRKALLREIMKVFMAENLFARLHNVKKYLIMYSIIANQILEETKQLVEAEERIFGEKKKLRESLDKDIRRMNGQKSYIQHLSYTFQKIEKYKIRPTNDAQSKYINKDEEGLAIYNSIVEVKDFLFQLAKNQKILSPLESAIMPEDEIQCQSEKQLNQENKQNYKTAFVKTYQSFRQNVEKIKSTCMKAFETCFKIRLPENFHKYDTDDENDRESHRLYTIEFQLMIKALFYLNIHNFADYQTLIVTNLGLGDPDRRNQVKKLPKDELKKKSQKLQFIRQLLNQYKPQSQATELQQPISTIDQTSHSYEDQESNGIKDTDQGKFKKQNLYQRAKA